MTDDVEFLEEWESIKCNKQKEAFICKKYTEPKFVYHEEKVDWYTASDKCEEDGMYLATLDSPDDLVEARRVIAEARID